MLELSLLLPMLAALVVIDAFASGTAGYLGVGGGIVLVSACRVVIGITFLITPFGVRLAPAMNPKPLKRAFAIFLTLVAPNMPRKVLGW